MFSLLTVSQFSKAGLVNLPFEVHFLAYDRELSLKRKSTTRGRFIFFCEWRAVQNRAYHREVHARSTIRYVCIPDTELTGSVRVLKPRAPSPVMLSCSCEGSAGERDGDDEINMRNQTSLPSRWGHGVIEPRNSSVLLLINKNLSINSRTLLNKSSFL